MTVVTLRSGVYENNASTCDDGDPCSITGCDGGSCVVVEIVEGCCTQEDGCGYGERCDLANQVCEDVSCLPCEADEDCGPTNFCVPAYSGSYCAPPCAEGVDCPEGTTCVEEGGSLGVCAPVEGDCECVPTDEVACEDGQLFAVDSWAC